MIDNAQLSLVKSSFLKKSKETKGYKIAHLVTGRQFVVDEATIEVLDFFNQPQAIHRSELSQSMGHSIDFMIEGGLLVEAEKARKETYYTTYASQTFFGFEQYDPTNKEQEVVLIGVPFSGGNPSSSAPKYFPGFLRNYLHKHNLKLTPQSNPNYHILGNNAEVYQLENLINNTKIKDGGDIFIHFYESRTEVYEKIKHIQKGIINNNKIPFSIGGDHSISYPIINSIAQKYPAFNVLHFDAHTDVYSSSYESILDKNGLHHHGNFVTKCLELDSLKKYYQFGIRGINNAFHKNDNPKLEMYWADYVKAILHKADTIDLPPDEYYYITFDIDVLDPAVAPGTATPLPGGFSFEEIILLFKKLGLENKKIIGIDFVEVNTEKDKQNLTTSLSAQLILNLLNFINLDY